MRTIKPTNRKKLVFSTAAFIASTAIGSVPVSAWTGQEKRAAYLNSGEFTNCDLKRLVQDHKNSGYGNSYDEVMFRIGRDILVGNTQGAKRASQRAREDQRYNSRAKCAFEDGDYSYEDAEKLAKYWGMSNVEDAKRKTAKFLERGLNLEIRAKLKSIQ